MPPYCPVEVRFPRKYKKQENECWEWTAAKQKDGYGVFRWGAETLAHRASWMLYRGPIPNGLYVLHSCDNPGCVNPDHLFLGTQLDNMTDMKSKGRQPDVKGERHPGAKLSEADIQAIRADPRKHKEIAADFGIRHTHVYKIKARKLWAHV